MNPSVDTLRQKLHQYIDLADAKKVKAFYTILQTDITENNVVAENYTLSPKQVKELEKRRKDFIDGKAKTYTWEKAKKMLGKKNGL